jgi:hypothetical protein
MTAQLFFSFELPRPLPGLRSLFNLRPVNGIRVVECQDCGCSFRGESDARCVECGSRYLKVIPNYATEDCQE